MLCSGLVSQVGASHRVNLIAPLPLGQNCPRKKDHVLMLAMPYSRGLTGSKQLPMAANILSSISVFFGSYRLNSVNFPQWKGQF